MHLAEAFSQSDLQVTVFVTCDFNNTLVIDEHKHELRLIKALEISFNLISS